MASSKIFHSKPYAQNAPSATAINPFNVPKNKNNIIIYTPINMSSLDVSYFLKVKNRITVRPVMICQIVMCIMFLLEWMVCLTRILSILALYHDIVFRFGHIRRLLVVLLHHILTGSEARLIFTWIIHFIFQQ